MLWLAARFEKYAPNGLISCLPQPQPGSVTSPPVPHTKEQNLRIQPEWSACGPRNTNTALSRLQHASRLFCPWAPAAFLCYGEILFSQEKAHTRSSSALCSTDVFCQIPWAPETRKAGKKGHCKFRLQWFQWNWLKIWSGLRRQDIHNWEL